MYVIVISFNWYTSKAAMTETDDSKKDALKDDTNPDFRELSGVYDMAWSTTMPHLTGSKVSV